MLEILVAQFEPLVENVACETEVREVEPEGPLVVYDYVPIETTRNQRKVNSEVAQEKRPRGSEK